MSAKTNRSVRGGVAATGVTVAVWMSATASAPAGIPESYRQAWSDPALVRRIEQNIEKYRKQDAAIEIVSADGRPIGGATVRVEQKRHHFLFGCNGFVLGQLDTPGKNRLYEERFTQLFNFVTVPFYWEGTEPTQGELRYAEGCRDLWRRPPPDRYLPFAQKHGLTLKGHPLLWHAYNPSWLPRDVDALRTLYRKRFGEIAGRYAGKIGIWDVVNESLVCSTNYPLYTPKRDYVAWAFRQVEPLFPKGTTLMINEVTASHGWGAGVSNRYYRQVRELLDGGAAVRGIGFQFHYFSPDAIQRALDSGEYPPAKMLDLYERFSDFSLPLFVTEITIPTPAGGQEMQAEIVANLYRLWFSAPKMAGITWWNLGDGTAVKGENVAQGGLLDEAFAPKASYRALDRLINHDWKTSAELQADEKGVARFRGFCGSYAIRVTAGGVTKEFDLDLTPPAAATRRLVVGP